MSTSSKRSSILSVLGGLGWPLIFGLSLCSVFYVLLLKGPLQDPITFRYFASHPVSYVATAMFFVGMAALVAKLFDVLYQFSIVRQIRLENQARTDLPIIEAERYLQKLEKLSDAARRSYLATRLHDALTFVKRKRSAMGLDDQLRYLSDMDVARQQEGYAFARIIIWATPMLGFLGTVIGITRALGDLDPVEMANSIQIAMEKLLSGLYVAFDTTALALSLAIVLMFVQFVINRIETELLSIVDTRAEEELIGRFTELHASDDPHVAAIQRMCEAVIESTARASQSVVESTATANQTVMESTTQMRETFAESTQAVLDQQADAWQQSIASSQAQWTGALAETRQSIEQGLTAAMAETVREQAVELGKAQQAVAAGASQQWQDWQAAALTQTNQLWQDWQQALAENSQQLHAQQVVMGKQSEVMSKALRATSDVIKLEKALNDNLQHLASAGHFEETMVSLAAAIHLLNARLGQAPAQAKAIDLSPSKQRQESQDQAA